MRCDRSNGIQQLAALQFTADEIAILIGIDVGALLAVHDADMEIGRLKAWT